MVKDRLAQPVGRFMRPCVAVDESTSMQIAIERMREAGQNVIPVVNEGRLTSVLTEKGIFRFLAENAHPSDPVTKFSESAASIDSRLTGAEALRQLESHPYLMVIDQNGIVGGLLTPSCFIGIAPQPERPGLVGGMATPFGVYLTSGAVRGGKKGWYLFCTGLFMISFFFVGHFAVYFLGQKLPEGTATMVLLSIMPFVLMIALFRLFPIAGYHAAEHQVVHALEREEELIPEVVERMPRVHPRCGTNIAVVATMFLTIERTPWVADEDMRFMAAILVTLFFWRPVGSFVQQHFTTKKANRKQIESGIAAAKELLDNYAVAPRRTASPFTRILNSGILHVMAGSTTAYLLALLITKLLKIDLGLS